MIDKLQKLKEEEIKNKKILSEGSFDTIFSNGVIDSIYNKDSFISNTFGSLISLEFNNDLDEEEEFIKIEYIIQNIEKFEDKNFESMGKKQIIYKKEFKGLRSLSKSTNIKNGKEIKGADKSINNIETENYNNENLEKEKRMIKNNKEKNKKYVKLSENIRVNTETKSESDEESNNENVKIIDKKAKKDNKFKTIIDKNNKNEKNNSNDDDIKIKNKKKKFIVLKGNRHYFIRNKEKNEKSLENTYNNTNEEQKYIFKTENNENQFFFSTMNKNNNNSFSHNKNLSKDSLRGNNHNLILYKKKLCNDTRGLSISKKNVETENNDKILHKVSTNYTINGSKIVKIRKYFINEQKSLIFKNKNINEYFKNNKRNIKQDSYMNYNDKQNINLNYFKTITYSKNNFDSKEQNKNNYSINGNIYYKKLKFDNLRNSCGEKTVPRKFKKLATDIHSEIRKKQYININNSIEEKDERSKNNEDNNIQNHRYYRINQYNNKKFKLRAPKNYYKIDFIENK